MGFSKRARSLLVLMAGLTALTLAVASPVSGALIVATYSVPSATSSVAVCTSDGCIPATVAGDGSATRSIPTDPYFGSFSFTLVPSDPYQPGDPYRPGTGTLSVTWSDQSTTTASFAYKSRDGRGWLFAGSVTSGVFAGRQLTGSIFVPPNPIEPVSAFVSFVQR